MGCTALRRVVLGPTRLQEGPHIPQTGRHTPTQQSATVPPACKRSSGWTPSGPGGLALPHRPERLHQSLCGKRGRHAHIPTTNPHSPATSPTTRSEKPRSWLAKRPSAISCDASHLRRHPQDTRLAQMRPHPRGSRQCTKPLGRSGRSKWTPPSPSNVPGVPIQAPDQGDSCGSRPYPHRTRLPRGAHKAAGTPRPSTECSSPNNHGEPTAWLHRSACRKMPQKRSPSLRCPMAVWSEWLCRWAARTRPSQPPRSPIVPPARLRRRPQAAPERRVTADAGTPEPPPAHGTGEMVDPQHCQQKPSLGPQPAPDPKWAERKPPAPPPGFTGELGCQQTPTPQDKLHHWIQNNLTQGGSSRNRQRRCRGGRPQAMTLRPSLPEAAHTHTPMMSTCRTPTASHSNWEPSPDHTPEDHPMSCPTKAARSCCPLKMCAARANPGTASFSATSQRASCNNMAVTPLAYTSCSMMVSLTLVRPSTFNCSIVAPSPLTTAAARSEKGHRAVPGPRLRPNFGLVSCHRH